ncbi:MAG: hypothetical protein JRK53_12620 [Deltaproteobacteria bacterium]|nr:hypothetical protein [Deltaproteobacteria bacterium]
MAVKKTASFEINFSFITDSYETPCYFNNQFVLVLSEAVFVFVVVIVIEQIMQFGHEQLDLYRVSLKRPQRELGALRRLR